jgi:hypothetical protein
MRHQDYFRNERTKISSVRESWSNGGKIRTRIVLSLNILDSENTYRIILGCMIRKTEST